MESSNAIENISSQLEYINYKIVFFVYQGADSFLHDLISQLSQLYSVRKIVIKKDDDFPLIDKWMEWGDLCWFEWCDKLLLYGSKLPLAKNKKIVCRLHSYEAFTQYPGKVNWNNVDKVIFIAEHIKNIVVKKYRILDEKTAVIPNGVNMNKWTFNTRNPGFNIAYIGYINYKKGPMLLLQAFKYLFDRDSRYKLYIAGQFQDHRYYLYYQQMIKELNIENNFFFQGWQNDLDNWLNDKNFVLNTSVLESQNMSIMQAMSKGIKPVIHNFAGAQNIYPKRYLWNTVEEAFEMVTEQKYSSIEYKSFIEKNYSLEKQVNTIVSLINQTIKCEREEFNYKTYWENRLNSRFNIQGVGNIGLGEIHNRLLYKNRIDILDNVLNLCFKKIDNIRVMELGPGTGIFTDFFHQKKIKQYYAVDIVKKSVVELSKKYKCYHFKQGDICKRSNFEGKHDLILAADVLLHITNEKNYEKAISNIAAHLDDNGLCVLMDPISVINTRSTADHAVIRNKEYVEKVLEDNQLELVNIFPISFFLNYPFDRNILGNQESYVLELYNIIIRTFASSLFTVDDKSIIGAYLSTIEKQLIHKCNFGLSEKLLIIQKSAAEQKYNFRLQDIIKIDDDIINNTTKIRLKILFQNETIAAIHKLYNQIEKNCSKSYHNNNDHEII
ncbi:glycosyltransferase [Candidatus Contubernalis alkaliaceticus]|uniref:glycosyltransferase n=1 Tax=Candidatus Contubernalis alkaliaceticus TaxID=338645 RepID=UPI001F4BDC5D|nr:glycosyltransferase [Candidatus Contubernalis alkalaceticus]UNC92306.1 glycosyltransferase [Candidatus Contubernalis alkalaceticus]